MLFEDLASSCSSIVCISRNIPSAWFQLQELQGQYLHFMHFSFHSPCLGNFHGGCHFIRSQKEHSIKASFHLAHRQEGFDI